MKMILKTMHLIKIVNMMTMTTKKMMEKMLKMIFKMYEKMMKLSRILASQRPAVIVSLKTTPVEVNTSHSHRDADDSAQLVARLKSPQI